MFDKTGVNAAFESEEVNRRVNDVIPNVIKWLLLIDRWLLPSYNCCL